LKTYQKNWGPNKNNYLKFRTKLKWDKKKLGKKYIFDGCNARDNVYGSCGVMVAHAAFFEL
jgi:hypothetical protein